MDINMELLKYYEQNSDPYAPYRDKDIAVEIETTSDSLLWGLRLRQNTGTISVNWGDGVSESVSATESTFISHTYENPGKYIFTIADASKLNDQYCALGASGYAQYAGMVTRVINWRIPTSKFISCSRAIIEQLYSATRGFDLYDCHNATIFIIPSGVRQLQADVIKNCFKITSLTFEGTPTFMDTRAFRSSSLTDIYVPWSEGEVANAPWGATKAIIHYNHTS